MGFYIKLISKYVKDLDVVILWTPVRCSDQIRETHINELDFGEIYFIFTKQYYVRETGMDSWLPYYCHRQSPSL